MTAGRANHESVSHHWGTPHHYVDAICRFFGGQIDLDPCSNPYSVVKAAKEYMLPETDGLVAPWDAPRIFVNPPYGADRKRGTTIKDWLRQCARAYRAGSEIIALVPVATNTSHWKNYVWGVADSVAFLYDTRLKFLVNGRNGGKGAPMSCALIYWGNRHEQFRKTFDSFGAVVDIRELNKNQEFNAQDADLFPAKPVMQTQFRRRA